MALMKETLQRVFVLIILPRAEVPHDMDIEHQHCSEYNEGVKNIGSVTHIHQILRLRHEKHEKIPKNMKKYLSRNKNIEFWIKTNTLCDRLHVGYM